jgi:hypothetical protein
MKLNCVQKSQLKKVPIFVLAMENVIKLRRQYVLWKLKIVYMFVDCETNKINKNGWKLLRNVTDSGVFSRVILDLD